MKKIVHQKRILNTTTAPFRMHNLAACLLAALLFPTATLAADLPFNGGVSAGNANISTSGNTTTVNQNTSKLVINWEEFNIGVNKTVNFNQPNANSIALNRVVGPEASKIAGKLTANGQVFLINPNGVAFTKNAQVNVGGLVVSTLALSNADFLNGNYKFTNTDKVADVVNEGFLNAHAAGGYVVLQSNHTVNNTGTITAHGNPNGSTSGQIALLAGNTSTLNIAGNNLVSIQVDAGAFQNVLVQNSGVVVTPNGRIMLTAYGTNKVIDLAVNNTGTLVATGMDINPNNGAITLDSGSGLMSLSAASNPYEGKSILATGELRMRAGAVNAQGTTVRQVIYAGSLSVTGVGQEAPLTFSNVDITANDRQSFSSDGNILLNKVNLNSNINGVSLQSFKGQIRIDNSSLSGQSIGLSAKQTVNGGSFRMGLNQAAIVLNNVNLTAKGPLSIEGFTEVIPTANGAYGPSGIIISGNSKFKTKHATITGLTNSDYQALDYMRSSGITLNGNLSLEGDLFYFTGISNGGGPAFYMANSQISLSKDAQVQVLAYGNSNPKSMGLVGIAGSNRINGPGQFKVTTEADLVGPVINFYGASLEASAGTDVRFNAKNTGAGNAIRVGGGSLKNIRLSGQATTGAGILLQSDSSSNAQLEKVWLNGSSTSGAGIKVEAGVSAYNSVLQGVSDTGTGVEFQGGTLSGSGFNAKSEIAGVSRTGTGLYLGQSANLFDVAHVFGTSQSGIGAFIGGSVNYYTTIEGTSLTREGVYFAPTAKADRITVWGKSRDTYGVRLNGTISNSNIIGASASTMPTVMTMPGAQLSSDVYKYRYDY